MNLLNKARIECTRLRDVYGYGTAGMKIPKGYLTIQVKKYCGDVMRLQIKVNGKAKTWLSLSDHYLPKIELRKLSE
jgi:hypothetical protein